MNFLIIGHSVVDKIIEKSKTSINPGGIFYSVISFLSQLNADDKIFLCSDIDKKSEKLFSELYDEVECKFMQYVESIPEVELKIDDEKERKENYSHIGQNLELPKENLNQFDGILINMITGFDISLTQLQEFRKNYSGLIYFDVHTLSRGVDKNFNRSFRKINEFEKWAKCIDILQANESELQTLSNQNDELKIIEEMFSLGVKQVIITRADRGASVYFSEDNILNKYDVGALQVEATNKVGCGDVFGSVYFYNFIKNKNVTLSFEKANLFAGISTTYYELKDYLNLKSDANKQIGKK